MRQIAQPVGSDPIQKLLNSEEFIGETLVALTESEPSMVRRRFKEEALSLGANVRHSMQEMGCAYHEWSQELVRFYETTDAFLFESLVYNRSNVKAILRNWILDFVRRHHRRQGPSRILVHGDGLGIDSCYLAMAGYQVDYFEVSEKAVQFACKLRDKLNVNFSVIRCMHDVPCEHYDFVLTLDVLEHVPDPPCLVRELASKLRPGGLLIVNAPFWFVHSAVPTHLAKNITYSGDLNRLYKPVRLEPVDCGSLWTPLALQKLSIAGTVRPISFHKAVWIQFNRLLVAFARVSNRPHIGLLYVMSLAERVQLRLRRFG